MQTVFNLGPEDTTSPPILAWRRRWLAEVESDTPRSVQHYHIPVRGRKLSEAVRALAAERPEFGFHITEGQDSDGELHTLVSWDTGFCMVSHHAPPTDWNPCDPRRMTRRPNRHGSVSIDFFTPAGPETMALVNLVKAHRRKHHQGRVASVGLIVAQGGRLHLDDLTMEGQHRLRPENYAPGVVEGFGRLRDFVRWRTPSEAGNLVLLDGPPGTGKTSLIRALIAGTRAPFVLAAGATIGSLEDPNFLPFILMQARERGGLVLILEDADAVILKRELIQDLSLLSSLLNATSGILGDLTKLRVIATVNTWNDERVDDAVVRPGRLFTRLSLGELPVEAARAVVLRERAGELAAAKVTGPMTLAAAYELARAHAPPKRGPSRPSESEVKPRFYQKPKLLRAFNPDDFEEV